MHFEGRLDCLNCGPKYYQCEPDVFATLDDLQLRTNRHGQRNRGREEEDYGGRAAPTA